MTFDEYQRAARRTTKPISNALDTFWTTKDKILNGALGLAGEAGEVVDIIKKNHCGGRHIDAEKIKLELGDIMWYMVEVCDAFGITLEGVAIANIEKLKARHPDGFKNWEGKR